MDCCVLTGVGLGDLTLSIVGPTGLMEEIEELDSSMFSKSLDDEGEVEVIRDGIVDESRVCCPIKLVLQEF